MSTVPAIGIYLAETNCSVGIYINGKVHLVPDLEGCCSIPSYVRFDKDRDVACGHFAKQNVYRNSENTIYDLMRIIGRKFDDPELQQDRNSWDFTVKMDGDVPKLLINGQLHSPEQVLGMLLTNLRVMAGCFLNLEPVIFHRDVLSALYYGLGFPRELMRMYVNSKPYLSPLSAVITVPAYFNDAQRKAVRDSGELAGLNVLSILDCPTAAALAYFGESLHANSKNILIYDMGAREFNLSILAMDHVKIKSLGKNRDNRLGGIEFVKEMMKYCASCFHSEYGIDLYHGKDSSNMIERDKCRRYLRRLYDLCKSAKKSLSHGNLATISIEHFHGHELTVLITMKKFEELNLSYFQRTITLVEFTLWKAGLRKEDIDDVILVGGFTQIPKVQTMLREFFNGKDPQMSIAPEFVVTHGAAIQAAKLNGEQFSRELKSPEETLKNLYPTQESIAPASRYDDCTDAKGVEKMPDCFKIGTERKLYPSSLWHRLQYINRRCHLKKLKFIFPSPGDMDGCCKGTGYTESQIKNIKERIVTENDHPVRCDG